jgi:hypothetical protein
MTGVEKSYLFFGIKLPTSLRATAITATQVQASNVREGYVPGTVAVRAADSDKFLPRETS